MSRIFRSLPPVLTTESPAFGPSRRTTSHPAWPSPTRRIPRLPFAQARAFTTTTTANLSSIIFDSEGSFGISSSVTNPAGVYGITGDAKHSPSPRFTGPKHAAQHRQRRGDRLKLRPIPSPLRNTTSPSPWGLDNELKTPYSENHLTSPFNVNFPADSRLKVHTSAASDVICCRALTLRNQSITWTRTAEATTTRPVRQLSKDVDAQGGNYGVTTDGIRANCDRVAR